jgi:cytochrome c oxidase assembly protein subunit 15
MARYFFISTRYRHRSPFVLITFGLAFLVILLGAYTRLTDAGLSCPDWPHCYGYLTAPHTTAQLQSATQHYPLMPINIKKAWTEMTHRYFAGTEGILILILSFSLLLRPKVKDLKAKVIALILIALLSLQVMLGMLTVTEKLKPVIVLSHLLTGISILSVLWWAYLELPLRDVTFFLHQQSTHLKPWLLLGCVIVAAQISLGGWVSTHYAGLACVDFPYCNAKLLPALQWHHLNTDLITIHMLHRIGAFITACYLSLLALCLFKNTAFRTFALLLFVLLALQLTLGILNIIWLRPVWIALTHQAVAILLLLTMITAWVKASLMTGKRYGSWIA